MDVATTFLSSFAAISKSTVPLNAQKQTHINDHSRDLEILDTKTNQQNNQASSML